MIRWLKDDRGFVKLQEWQPGSGTLGEWEDVPIKNKSTLEFKNGLAQEVPIKPEQPEPRKPREWYLKPREDGGMDWALDSQGPGWVKFREVLEE